MDSSDTPKIAETISNLGKMLNSMDAQLRQQTNLNHNFPADLMVEKQGTG